MFSLVSFCFAPPLDLLSSSQSISYCFGDTSVAVDFTVFKFRVHLNLAILMWSTVFSYWFLEYTLRTAHGFPFLVIRLLDLIFL